MSELIRKLKSEGDLSDDALLSLLDSSDHDAALFAAADAVRRTVYGDAVYTRGLIEISSYCRNDCYYCGIRRSNGKAERYRLREEEIMAAAATGHALGYRTFVLQGGEDPHFNDDRLCAIVTALKGRFADCAVTLSLGERSEASYAALRAAGVDRYLLRHETASVTHYRKLHPETMSLAARKECLFTLKRLGFQVGSGFMVGSPWQKPEHIVADLRFLQELQPDMIGIGPYIHHDDTPFAACADGSVTLTVRLVAVLRLMFPHALIPATTALGSLAADGQLRALKAGANVVMPNVSPPEQREKYTIYANKAGVGETAKESFHRLESLVKTAGYRLVSDVGHVKK